MSVAEACEVISKLAMGVLINSKLLYKHTISGILFLLAGTGAVVTALLRNASTLMGYAAVLGFRGLNFPCLAETLLADCVPSQALGGAVGLYLMAYGAGISLGYPLIGKDLVLGILKLIISDIIKYKSQN